MFGCVYTAGPTKRTFDAVCKSIIDVSRTLLLRGKSTHSRRVGEEDMYVGYNLVPFLLTLEWKESKIVSLLFKRMLAGPEYFMELLHVIVSSLHRPRLGPWGEGRMTTKINISRAAGAVVGIGWRRCRKRTPPRISDGPHRRELTEGEIGGTDDRESFTRVGLMRLSRDKQD